MSRVPTGELRKAAHHCLDFYQTLYFDEWNTELDVRVFSFMRYGTDPYVWWCERDGTASRPFIPIVQYEFWFVAGER